ncbi:MAG: hypothetical protein CM1200mP2_05490 [Planctomycetaceae bacterium]|nr:MAG: hypothetical protein CM1200mP2_05490 [Planctomycetaceae bacterium]
MTYLSLRWRTSTGQLEAIPGEHPVAGVQHLRDTWQACQPHDSGKTHRSVKLSEDFDALDVLPSADPPWISAINAACEIPSSDAPEFFARDVDETDAVAAIQLSEQRDPPTAKRAFPIEEHRESFVAVVGAGGSRAVMKAGAVTGLSGVMDTPCGKVAGTTGSLVCLVRSFPGRANCQHHGRGQASREDTGAKK